MKIHDCLKSLLDWQTEPQFLIDRTGILFYANQCAKPYLDLDGWIEGEKIPGLIWTWLQTALNHATIEKNFWCRSTTHLMQARWDEHCQFFTLRFSEISEPDGGHYDPLTHLPNHILFKQQISEYFSVHKSDMSHCALLFLDVEKFKLLNTKFNYETGDKLLIILAERLFDAIPPSSMVSRISGNEFAVFLHQLDNRAELDDIISKIRQRMACPFLAMGQAIHINVRIGVALWTTEISVDALMNNALAALNQARYQKTSIQDYCAHLQKSLDREQYLIDEIPEAMKRGDFLLFYEPRVNLGSNIITGAEALLRWHHPSLGMVMPGEFIPLAERSGHIVQLGRWVLNQVCTTLQSWQNSGRNRFQLSMNVSALELTDYQLILQLEKYYQSMPESLRHLDLEITENLLMDDLLGVSEVMRRISGFGVKFSIDDFGTGYSSLRYLTKLPVNKLKIDKSFVRPLPSHGEEMIVVRSIIQLAKQLELIVCAEGVEKSSQLSYLQENGCHEAQGYYWSKPMLLSQFETWCDQYYEQHYEKLSNYTA